MSHLDWIERPDGWRSGPYRIELVAPRTWVLSRHDRDPGLRGVLTTARIERTAGSLSALKATAAEVERRRRLRRRMVRRLAVLVLAVSLLIGSSLTSGGWTPLVVTLAAGVGFTALLGAIDLLVRRSWEALRDTYQ